MTALGWIVAGLVGIYVASYAAEAWAQRRRERRHTKIASDLETRKALNAMHRIGKGRL